MKTLSHNNQSGRSMVEMLGVLAIIGVLSVGGISGYSKAMGKYKVIKALDQIAILTMNIRTAYAGSKDYSGLTTTAAIDGRLALDEMISGTKLLSSFGGEVNVSDCSAHSGIETCANIVSGNEVRYFGVKFSGLSKDACRALGASDWGKDGLASVNVNGASYSGIQLPVNVGTAADKCNATTNTNYVQIVYY